MTVLPSLGLRLNALDALDALVGLVRDRPDLKRAQVVLTHVPAPRSWLPPAITVPSSDGAVITLKG
jgi:hypothetical protein